MHHSEGHQNHKAATRIRHPDLRHSLRRCDWGLRPYRYPRENGFRLKDAWAETPRTYLGMLAEGFPNMLMVLGPHTARGNITQAISHSVEFQADMLRFMQQHNYTRVETRPEKVDEWTRIVIKAGEALLSFKVDSWQNGVNRNVEGRTVRRVLGYNGNGAHFRRTTDEVAKGGYQEFAFR